MRNSYDKDSLDAMDNCARLAAYLCREYGLTVDDIYTHTYWLHIRDKDSISKSGDKDKICTAKHSYKTCPLYIIPQWNKFLELVVKYYGGAKSKKVNTSTVSTVANSATTPLPYKIKVIDWTGLNVRSGAGVNNSVVTTVGYGEVYTIVAEKTVNGSKWGKLKSGAGWVNVSSIYVKKV